MEYFKVLATVLALLALVTGFYLNNSEEPPGIVLNTQESTFKGVRGSYCWQGQASAKCVDTVSPEELVKSGNVSNITVGRYDEILFSTKGYEEPETYRYEIMYLNGTKIFSGEGGNLNLNQTGNYILSVSARWDRGDLNYAFPIKVE